MKDTVVRLATKSKPVTIEDSIRQHFGIEDSIKVIQSRYYSSDAPEHALAFIDFNKQSRFYSDLSAMYGCDCMDSEFYNSKYNNQLFDFHDSISNDINLYNHLFLETGYPFITIKTISISTSSRVNSIVMDLHSQIQLLSSIQWMALIPICY